MKFSLYLAEDLHERLKIQAIKSKISMKDYVTNALETKLKQDQDKAQL